MSAGDLFSRLIGFAVTVYLANVLGPKGFGQISFALAFMSYFLLVGDMGTDTFGTRELSRGTERMREDVENLISLKLLLAIISLILYVAVIWIVGFPDAFRNLLLLYGLAIIPMAFQGEWIFRGIQRMEFIGIGRLVKAAAYAVPVFLLVRCREQILRIPGCYALSISIAAVFLMGLYVKRTGLIHLKLRPRLWRSVLLRSIPIGFSLIMSKVYYNMDSVFLGFMKSDYSVGIYNAAYKVILFILSFWFIFGNVSFPAITQLHTNSSKMLGRFLSILVRVALTVSLPMAIGGTIVAKQIMALIYPDAFGEGVVAFQILIWSVLIIAMSTTYANLLIAIDKAKKYMWAVTLGAIANTGLNLLLIPRFDFVGAGLATVFTETMIFTYLYKAVSKSYPFQVERAKAIVIASVLMGVVLYPLRHLPLAVLVILGAASYLLLLVLFKGYSREELAVLRRSLRRK